MMDGEAGLSLAGRLVGVVVELAARSIPNTHITFGS
jgi:hypothetical protein